MKRSIELAGGEGVRWKGRPAPRCYTFRNWPHSLFGGVLLLITGFWQMMGIEMAATSASAWLAWLPLPFLLLSGYLAVGHLFQARLEWNRVFYLITDRRLLVQRGLFKPWVESMDLGAVTYFSLHHHGRELGTLRVHRGKDQKLVLHCVEYPRLAADLLEEAITQGAAKDSPDHGVVYAGDSQANR
jgi:hypothetical protein